MKDSPLKLLKSIVAITCVLCFVNLSHGQSPLIKEWDATFGGDNQEVMHCSEPTIDGGYILGGWSNTDISGDKTRIGGGNGDFWVVKINNLGKKEWDACFGGNEWDQLISLKQTNDGGYILGGFSYSDKTGDKSEASRGLRDYWIVKIDNSGSMLWDISFGTEASDYLTSIDQAKDGGFIIGGYTQGGISGDKSHSSQGGLDYWVVKVNKYGIKEWDKTFGGNGDDVLSTLSVTFDGGYILGGSSYSGFSGDKTSLLRGMDDYWIVKIDSNGMLAWEATFGGNNWDHLTALKEAKSGGYILGGQSKSSRSGEKTHDNQGDWDYWVVKINENGQREWDFTYGGQEADILRSIDESIDDGYILGGDSFSGISGDKSEESYGLNDYWIVGINSIGIKQFDATLGSNKTDDLHSVRTTDDGGYILGGYSSSEASNDKTQPCLGVTDYWVVKVKSQTPASLTDKNPICKQDCNLQAYPNPSENKINVSFTRSSSEKYSVNLIDVTGRVILSEQGVSVEGENLQELDLTKVSKGIYTLQLNSKEKSETLRLVKR